MTTAETELLRADLDRQLDWPTRILIVDDAASTRHFLRAVLEYCPEFEVAGEAVNGTSAIEMADVLKPDVVLLDLSMPGTDGSGALGGLLRVAPDARVIILSGMDASQATPLLAAGATAFVPKGLAPFDLLERLGDILGISVTLERKAAVKEPSIDVAAPRSHAQPRAVICDDDAMVRHLVAEILSSCGVAVVAETDMVPNLLSVVELAKPELIVLDLWLEGTTGTTALPEIRLASPRTLVVVYSGYEEWRGKALGAGAAAFVAKPDLDGLAAAIHALMPGAAR